MSASIETAKQRQLAVAISKCRSKGLHAAADFLTRKGSRSESTGKAYSFALRYFNEYVEHKYNHEHNIQTILKPLVQREIDVYKLLDDFIPYLKNGTKNGVDMSPKSVENYMSAVKSYLLYNDVEISTIKFKDKVTMPAVYTEGELPLDAKDIREILNHCTNRRLKAYILFLASSGCRAVEALAVRIKDINFNTDPTEINIRKEFTKTRTQRTVFITSEASEYLKQWIDWKYTVRYRNRPKPKSEDDLVFSRFLNTSRDPRSLYGKVLVEFQKVLELCDKNGLANRKEDGILKRREISLHSFRRHVKTVLSNQVSADFSEAYIGHSNGRSSPYYRIKLEERRRIYKERCEKYLTYLSYGTVEAVGTSYVAKLEEKEREIEELRAQLRHVEVTKDAELQQLQQSGTANVERISKLEAKIDHIFNQWAWTTVVDKKALKKFSEGMERIEVVSEEEEEVRESKNKEKQTV
jgi:integrase